MAAGGGQDIIVRSQAMDFRVASSQEERPVFQDLKRFYQDESGPELVEWAVVTVILILATYAILSAIGDELTRIYNVIRDTLAGIG